MVINLSTNRTPIHVCQTEAIRDAVKQDLLERGVSEFRELVSNSSVIFIDFGGAISIGEQPYSVAGTPIQFFLQHYSHLRSAIDRAKQKPRKGDYYKIHGERAYCICTETFLTLDRYLRANETTLLQASSAHTEILLERIARISSEQDKR